MESTSVSPLSSLGPYIEQPFNDGEVVAVQAGQMKACFTADTKRLGYLDILAKEGIDDVEAVPGTEGNAEWNHSILVGLGHGVCGEKKVGDSKVNNPKRLEHYMEIR